MAPISIDFEKQAWVIVTTASQTFVGMAVMPYEIRGVSEFALSLSTANKMSVLTLAHPMVLLDQLMQGRDEMGRLVTQRTRTLLTHVQLSEDFTLFVQPDSIVLINTLSEHDRAKMMKVIADGLASRDEQRRRESIITRPGT